MVTRSIAKQFVPVFAGLILLSGCSETIFTTVADSSGSYNFPSGPSTLEDFGATAGGVQDMGLARELVVAGRVPPAAAFVVEGMFSEHDLPLVGQAADEVLNLRGAIGVGPNTGGNPAAWIQIGMSSNIDPDNFQRPSQTIIACVDVSGSMGWFYHGEETEYINPGSLAVQLLHRVSERLDNTDRLGIVTYGSSVTTLLEPVPGNSPDIETAISSLDNNGSTNMEAGLVRAFELARNALEFGTDAVRVILFTDIQPNVGATEPGSFRELTRQAAQSGIGLTVMGLGVGMGQEIMNAISDLRGGNAFSCATLADVDALIEDQWPWLICPIAHDLALELITPDGFEIGAAYGFPGSDLTGNVGFSVSSVFLSRRRGALLVRLDPRLEIPSEFTATASLSYTTLAGTTISQRLNMNATTSELDEHGFWFEQLSLNKTVELAVLVSSMQQAAAVYQDDPDLAISIMRAATDRIADAAQKLTDAGLTAEAQFAGDLLALMEAGAEQGDMYGMIGI